jgi:DNA-binding transcriptional regulator YdaS (Cro superfamily)
MARNLTPRKALERAVKICGSQSELARRLGGKIKQQHIHYWLENGLSPVQAIPIEQAVNGAVTRHELRPDVFGEKAEAA